jgi:hypothetical protein
MGGSGWIQRDPWETRGGTEKPTKVREGDGLADIGSSWNGGDSDEVQGGRWEIRETQRR